jgi:hypothetical protein
LDNNAINDRWGGGAGGGIKGSKVTLLANCWKNTIELNQKHPYLKYPPLIFNSSKLFIRNKNKCFYTINVITFINKNKCFHTVIVFIKNILLFCWPDHRQSGQVHLRERQRREGLGFLSVRTDRSKLVGPSKSGRTFGNGSLRKWFGKGSALRSRLNNIQLYLDFWKWFCAKMFW